MEEGTLKQSGRKTKILSLAGQRPLAVITPINAFLKTLQGAVEIILIHTKQTETVAESCEKWFKEEYPAHVITLKLFSKERQFVEDICKDTEEICFNANPGMNWEIAFMSLYLPEHTKCLASDNEFMYLWNLMNDISTADKNELADLGLETYLNLSEDIRVKATSSPKNTLHPLLAGLVNSKSFAVSFKKPDKKRAPIQYLNERLIWINEYKGRLHLFFDFMSRPEDPSKKKKKIIKDHNRYRLVTTVFDPINYEVTIVSNREDIIKRAGIDGYKHIDALKNSDTWQKMLKKQIENSFTVKPKNVIPFKSAAIPIEGNHGSIGAKPLAVMFGDNVDPTLQAIHSHVPAQCDTAVIFYDKASPKICCLAERMQQVLLEQGINAVFLPTDHRGCSIIDSMKLINKDFIFNITPGTKMHTVVLTVTARKRNAIDRVYSINKSQIEPLVGGNSLPVIPPAMDEILKCQFAGHSPLSNKISNEALWDVILSGLNSNSIKSDANIFNPLYVESRFRISGNAVEFQGKTYELDPLCLKSGEGFWWEDVVARAIHKTLNIMPYTQVKWNWQGENRNGAFLSELDVVFPYNTKVVVISCKTGQDQLALNAYLVKSEAIKRFGRLSVLPFVALPHNKEHNKEFEPINGVGILSPSILANKDKLETSINSLASALSTTHESPHPEA